MGKRQFILGIFLASILGGAIAITGYNFVNKKEVKQFDSFEQQQNFKLSNFKDNNTESNKSIVPEGLNFVHAAEIVTPGVVHIMSSYKRQNMKSQNPFHEFFGGGGTGSQAAPQATGSGVILSSNGYIVTNNHVVEDANKVEIILNNNKKYLAEIIGTDPTTDLALLKVDAEDLPFVKFGNSDNLKIGEWVLAVGNPFNLTSTVTAGIISAKGRNINILRDANGRQIESFIQTDAVVNPGNSGGALVNLNGELVGINTAIASTTGSYTGYSFAVPVSLVKKVMDDLRKYGEVQRALLGVNIVEVVDPRLALDGDDKKELSGVYITAVGAGSGAEDAGLLKGDIIVGINGKLIKTVPELQEIVAQNRPGDKVTVDFLRKGRKKNLTVTLKNINHNTDIVRKTVPFKLEGAIFENFSNTTNEIQGVRISGIESGKWKDAGIKEGFIITRIDNNNVENIETLKRILDKKKGRVIILGVYPNGGKDYFSFNW